MKLIDLLARSAATHPQKIAAVHHDDQITFAGLWDKSYRLSKKLKDLNLAPGSRAALLFENGVQYIICYFAASAAGLVVVPLDTSSTPETLNKILKNCNPKVLIFQGKFQRNLDSILGENHSLNLIVSDKPIKPSSATLLVLRLDTIFSESGVKIEPPRSNKGIDDAPSNELAAIFYTSGSTGNSKGVQLSHRNLISNTVATVDYLKLTSNDSVIVILPFYYIYGNSLLLTHIASGATVVIDNRFMYPEAVMTEMEERRVTGFSGVPSNFMILLNTGTFAKRKFEHLRYFTQAGGAMAPEVIRKLMSAFPTKQIFIMYGQTEASPRATWLPPGRLAEKLGSIGIPVNGVSIELLDEFGAPVPVGETGEIVISGDNIMMGYWNHPQETSEVLRGGKLYTNDLARCDEEGFFYIVGRMREIIKSGGNRVGANEVEEIILEHPFVLEVAVIGVDDPILGEAIKAIVVMKSGQTLDAAGLKSFCQKKLAVHKIPKHVVFVDHLPKYQSGKVNKPLLKKHHS